MMNDAHIIDGLIENADYTRGGALEERAKAFKNEMRVMNVALVDRHFIDFLKAEYEGKGSEKSGILIAFILISISSALMGGLLMAAVLTAVGGG